MSKPIDRKARPEPCRVVGITRPSAIEIDQRARHRMAAAHRRMRRDVFLVGEQLLGKAAKRHEIQQVGLEQRAAVGDEPVADLEVAPVPAFAQLLHGVTALMGVP